MDPPKKPIGEDFIAYMKSMEKQLDEDISNSMIFNKKYAYLLGRGRQYDETCLGPKINYDIEPNNAIHIIISNNIYSVWFETQRVVKDSNDYELLDDFMTFYKTQTENIEIVGCFRPRRIYQALNLVSIIDQYIIQFQTEREDGFYVIKKPISVL